MSSENGIHVVVGASGGTGNAVARALAERGHRVRAVSRRGDADVPAGIERVAADVTKPEEARRAVGGASVVYHCAQTEYTRWPEDFPSMNRAVIGSPRVLRLSRSRRDLEEILHRSNPEKVPGRPDLGERGGRGSFNRIRSSHGPGTRRGAMRDLARVMDVIIAGRPVG